MRLNRVIFISVLVLALAVPGVRAAAWEEPTKDGVAEGQRLVAAMKAAERGPYKRLRWFCADGSVHPPSPYPCAELGGGVQHGEYSDDRARLAELGWHVGTILVATPWDELWSSEPRQQRLRELVIEKWTTDHDDGFVLRRARLYRGALQVEDEEKAGRDILLRALGDEAFLRSEPLLVRELVRALPHAGRGGDRTRGVRTASEELSGLDASFEPIRIRIHNAPAASDAQAARDWAADAERAGKDADLVTRARALADSIDSLYGDTGRAERIASAIARLNKGADADLAAGLEAAGRGTARERSVALGALLRDLRLRVEGSATATRRLDLLDLSLDLEPDALAAAEAALREPGLSRAALAQVALASMDGAFGAGLFSAGERDALAQPLASFLAAPPAEGPQAAEYLRAVRAIERASNWGVGTVRHAFAEPLARWTALEPMVARFPDDVLRGSTLLSLADASARLARDAERLAGLSHSIFGAEASGLAGLNPGVAIGPLRMVSEESVLRAETLPQDAIVVLPTTASDLTPVAGMLTVSEGNALSHVQMLARNLGIPNAVVPPLLRETLARHDGERVMLAVAPSGAVVLAREADVPAALRETITGEKRKAAASVKVEAPHPDLSVRRVLTLAELRASLSGKLVGPKAANVGELAFHFKDRVAPALALPFGFYAQHAATGPGSPKVRLDAAFEAHRAGKASDAQLAAEVEEVRKQVEALKLDPAARASLEKLMQETFGEPGTYGVFVRSDTNVEDLPQFTGAGLNQTIPNVVGIDSVMTAIPKVWSSPFVPRAMAWRAQALLHPEEVYPSVLLMKSVPSTKSGVLVTRDVATGGEGVTASVAWGVGGAVDGESAETIVLRPDGSVTVVSEAKAPYQRRLKPEGGVAWVAAPTGRVLTDDEIAQVRAFVGDLNRELEPARTEDGRALPWDVEFGFVEGRLALFQVRPLVERGAALADTVASALLPVRVATTARVDMSKVPESAAPQAARGGVEVVP